MKVLIVDDSGVMRHVISRELVALGFLEHFLSEAPDGEKALALVSSNHYDLITMDWNMPNLSGIDAVKAIRDKGITTPILMVTTEAERANVIQAIQLGANNYLIKPFTKEDLREKIALVITNHVKELSEKDLLTPT